MSWRLANSLGTFRNQINAMYPKRNKASDGTIGDAAHQAEGSASDHNPNAAGVVTAIDITHDPINGPDIAELGETLANSGDKRIKYIIANRAIWEPGQGWQPYYGADPHENHLHLSVNTYNYDDGQLWQLTQEEDMRIPDGKEVDAAFLRYTGGTPSKDQYKFYTSGPADYLYKDLADYCLNGKNENQAKLDALQLNEAAKKLEKIKQIVG